MDKKHFEGTLVLERLAAIRTIDEFFNAVDSDNFKMVNLLLREAKVDPKTILTIIKKMNTSDQDY
jgi:hypothetical protein